MCQFAIRITSATNYTLSRGQAKNPMLVFFTPFLPLAIFLLGVLVIRRDSGPSGESSPPGSRSACGKCGAETRRMRRQEYGPNKNRSS